MSRLKMINPEDSNPEKTVIEPEIVTEQEEKNNIWHKIIFDLAMLELELNA